MEQGQAGGASGYSKPVAFRLGLATSAMSAFAAAVMVAVAVMDDRAKVIDSAALEALEMRLERDPTDAALRAEIRRLDRDIREQFFRRRQLVSAGAVLLLGGALVLVTCLKWYVFVPASRLKPEVRKKTDDGGQDEAGARERRRTLLAIGATGALAVAALAVLGASPRAEWPERGPVPPSDGAKGSADPKEPVAAGKFEENWPQFRGPFGTGVVPGGQWPDKWDAKTDSNVVWKVPVPAPGKSSPVVWGERIFLTGGDRKEQVVMCFDRGDGKLLWKAPVNVQAAWKRGQGADLGEMDGDTSSGYAAPTPVTDGRRVCATFATGDIACFDLDGKPIWSRSAGKPDSIYGLASSLVLNGATVLWQLDQGGAADDKLSKLIALDIKTGKTEWEAPRPVPNSWCTPIVVDTGKRMEIVANGNPWIVGYDLNGGTELWRVDGLGPDAATSPVYADGIFYSSNNNAKALAIRAGGDGDITATHVVWTATENLPDTSSPICDGKFFVQATDGGRVTCWDAKKGTLLWEKELPGGFSASASLAGGKVYLPARNGKVYVFEMGKEYKEVAVCDVGEPVEASPAFVGGRIYIRGSRHLFCVGAK